MNYLPNNFTCKKKSPFEGGAEPEASGEAGDVLRSSVTPLTISFKQRY